MTSPHTLHVHNQGHPLGLGLDIALQHHVEDHYEHLVAVLSSHDAGVYLAHSDQDGVSS